MILQLLNPETDDLEKSYLATTYPIGTTSYVLKNADRFALNDRVMLGEMGEERTEILTVTLAATDGQTIALTASVFQHEADTPIYRLRFDQVRFYRSTTGINGAYSVISTQALDVDNANLSTLYDDTTGLSTYYYKMTVYNSISLLESAFSDPIPGGGFTRLQVGRVIDEILQEVGDQNQAHVTRSEILGYFNDVNDDLTTFVSKPFPFLHTRVAIPTIANQNYINFPTDSSGNQIMWKFDRMDYNFVDSTTTPATNQTYTLDVEEEVYFRNKYTDNTINSTTVSDVIKKMCIDDDLSRFRFEAPFKSTNCTLYLYYWSYFPVLDTEGDALVTFTPKIYKLYTKWRYYAKRSIVEPTFQSVATGFQQEYIQERSMYTKHGSKDVGTPKSFRPKDSVDKSFRIR